MHTSGGRVSTVIGGIQYSARGAITLDPANVEIESGVNQDATVYRLVKPKARTAECTFDRLVDVNGKPLRWDENLMLQSNLGITFIEADTGVTHLLSGGFLVGTPKIDLATGEVSGISLAAEAYKTVQ